MRGGAAKKKPAQRKPKQQAAQLKIPKTRKGKRGETVAKTDGGYPVPLIAAAPVQAQGPESMDEDSDTDSSACLCMCHCWCVLSRFVLPVSS